MRRRVVLPLLTTIALAGVIAGPASAANIRVQSTTDTIDAGLVDGLLKPAYSAAQPGDTLGYVGVGTGKALDNARTGIADVVITHAPSLEQQFVDAGFSYEPFGRAIFYSDYVIVGPTGDPAHVGDNAAHDAITAFEDIGAAGTAGTATFVSRGDNSGTNVQEQTMWGLTSTVPTQAASNGGADATRKEPGAGGALAGWYRKTNKGQAANLQDAAVCNASTYPNGGCYTMVDRGTFNRIHAQGLIDDLKIVAQNNTPTVRGGQDLLINPFHAYIVNPLAVPAGSNVDVVAAQRFVDFLTAPGFQASVASFPSAGDPAFRPDAFPAITVSTPAPETADLGTELTMGVNVDNRLPGAGAVVGIPVRLQRSIDGGASWSNTGSAVPSDRAGHAVFHTKLTAPTRYRVATLRYRDLSPTILTLGRSADRTKPALSRIGLGRRAVTVRISEAGTVRATVRRRTVKRVSRNGNVRTVVSFARIKRVTGTARKAGTVKLAWSHAIVEGTYRVTVRATDRTGNARTSTLGLRAR